MQLCYRGIPYNAQALTIPQVKTGTIARFRGAEYHVTRPAIDQPMQQPDGVVYRGIANGQRFNVRFLGRVYHYQPIVFVPTRADA